VFGNTEVSYLRTLPLERQREVLDSLFQEELACVVVTKGIDPPQALAEACEKAGLTLMRTPLLSSAFIQQVQSFLEESLTESSSLHGVLIDVFGVGVLLLGKSGIGKSEIALDLVMRGHRLVADDIVDVTRRRQGVVYGTGNAVIRHHMEIRGLGIINIKDLFGVAATRASKTVELVVKLERWEEHREYDRLGLDENVYELFGVRVPLICMPVAPGRNLATLVEVAARNQLLRSRGLNAARDLVERLERQLQEQETPPDSEEEPRSGEPR